jgi:hypothetical protein
VQKAVRVELHTRSKNDGRIKSPKHAGGAMHCKRGSEKIAVVGLEPTTYGL